MGWKIYSLGSDDNSRWVAEKAIAKLDSLGYEASFSQSDNYSGTFSVTIGGVVYSGPFNLTNTNSCPIYLAVNDATNEIIISKYKNTEYAGLNTNLNIVFSFALIRGVKVVTGETGLFTVNPTDGSQYHTNAWRPTYTGETIMLHRALFYPEQAEKSFVSDLYWGSLSLIPGATFTLGTDSFVCFSHNLYAKL